MKVEWEPLANLGYKVLRSTQDGPTDQIAAFDPENDEARYDTSYREVSLRRGDLTAPHGKVIEEGFTLGPQELEGTWVNKHWVVLRAESFDVHPRFLQWWLNSEKARKQMRKAVPGRGKKDIGLQDLPYIHVPIPPLDLQHAIADYASKIDEVEQISVRLQDQLGGLSHVLHSRFERLTLSGPGGKPMRQPEALKPAKRPRPKYRFSDIGDVIVRLDHHGLQAHGQVTTAGGITVGAGSHATMQAKKSLSYHHLETRQRLINIGVLQEDAEHDALIFIEPWEFLSVSEAASVIRGTPANGLREWKMPHGVSIGEFMRESQEDAAE